MSFALMAFIAKQLRASEDALPDGAADPGPPPVFRGGPVFSAAELQEAEEDEADEIFLGPIRIRGIRERPTPPLGGSAHCSGGLYSVRPPLLREVVFCQRRWGTDPAAHSSRGPKFVPRIPYIVDTCCCQSSGYLHTSMGSASASARCLYVRPAASRAAGKITMMPRPASRCGRDDWVQSASVIAGHPNTTAQVCLMIPAAC